MMKHYIPILFAVAALVGPTAALADYTITLGSGTENLSAIGNAAGSVAVSQSFETVGAGTLDSVSISLKIAAGTPGNPVHIEILSAGSAPGTGAALYETNISPSTSECADYTFTPGISVSAGTQYWIYESYGGTPGGEYYRGCGDTTDTYPDGAYWANDGGWADSGGDQRGELSITSAAPPPPPPGTVGSIVSLPVATSSLAAVAAGAGPLFGALWPVALIAAGLAIGAIVVIAIAGSIRKAVKRSKKKTTYWRQSGPGSSRLVRDRRKLARNYYEVQQYGSTRF